VRAPGWFDARLVLAAGVLLSLAAYACDTAPLLAPTNSSISLNASTRIVPLGGSSELQATVLENSGTPVPNGTTVRFTASLGRVEPAEAQTRNGVATAMFVAGTESGTAQIRAISGLASGGGGSTTTGGTTTTTTSANVLEIAVGAAAAGAITLSATPSTLRASGSSVEVLAFITATNGSPLAGIPVSFTATTGTISPIVTNTDSNGVARTTLTASAQTIVTATVGGGTAAPPPTGTPPTTPAPPTGTRSASLTINVAAVPSFTLAVSPTQPAANQPVSLTITPATGTAPRVTVNWGDSVEQDIGIVSAPRVIVHTYTNPGFYTITANGVSAEGDTFSNSTAVTVGQQPPVELTVTPTTGQIGTVFTFTITPTTGAIITNVRIDFGDGTSQEFGPISSQRTVQHAYSTTGTKTVTVEQTETGGRVTRATVVVSVTN
jgi:hypothetical protein